MLGGSSPPPCCVLDGGTEPDRPARAGITAQCFMPRPPLPAVEVEPRTLTNRPRTGQQYSEDFGKVNPLRLVPALKDGAFTMGESVAILKYLACKYKTPDHWYPADLQRRARVDEYLAWQHMTVRYQGCRIYMFRGLLPVLTGQPVPKDRMDEAVQDLQAAIQIFEDTFLQDRPYIAGQEVSLADLVALVALMQPVGTGLDPLEGRPKLMEWRERVKRDVGKELFDEAHEKLMKEKESLKHLAPKSPLMQQLAKKLQKVYK